MATINYSKTELGNRLFLIGWAGVAGGDVGQPFDASNSVALSRYGKVNTAPSGNVTIMASNEVGVPTNGISLGTPHSGSAASLFDISIKTRWYWPENTSANVGSLDIIILFQEL